MGNAFLSFYWQVTMKREAYKGEGIMATNQRLLQIIKVLRRYSFISNFYHQTNPDQVRHALEALGPAFIKLGQILSTRPDLVSPAYIQELQQLQDDAPVDDYDTIVAMYEAETGQTITEAFATFEKTPFASASIGQCHRATLPNGEASWLNFSIQPWLNWLRLI